MVQAVLNPSVNPIVNPRSNAQAQTHGENTQCSDSNKRTRVDIDRLPLMFASTPPPGALLFFRQIGLPRLTMSTFLERIEPCPAHPPCQSVPPPAAGFNVPPATHGELQLPR